MWDYGFSGDSRTVDVYVRWLREKIEVDPATPVYIQTVRGMGYRFNAQPVHAEGIPHNHAHG